MYTVRNVRNDIEDIVLAHLRVGSLEYNVQDLIDDIMGTIDSMQKSHNTSLTTCRDNWSKLLKEQEEHYENIIEKKNELLTEVHTRLIASDEYPNEESDYTAILNEYKNELNLVRGKRDCLKKMLLIALEEM